MKPKTVDGFAGFIGRQIGRVLADRFSSPLTDGVHSIRGLSGPILRAFIDAFLAEKIATSTWPSLAVLAAIVVIHFVSLTAFSHEQDRILVGLIVLAAYVWSAFGMVKGFNASLPHIRLWLVTRLIFQWVREKYSEVVSRRATADFEQNLVASVLMQVQQAKRVGPDDIAFMLAEHLAPVLIRHVISSCTYLGLADCCRPHLLQAGPLSRHHRKIHGYRALAASTVSAGSRSRWGHWDPLTRRNPPHLTTKLLSVEVQAGANAPLGKT